MLVTGVPVLGLPLKYSNGPSALYNTVGRQRTRDTVRYVARMRILSGNMPCGRLADHERSE